VVAVLLSAGDHEPVIPSLDVVGNAASVAPEQIGATGVNVGVTFGLTTTVVDPAALVHPVAVTVTVTLYVPALATVTPGMLGFCAADVKPPGPVQLYVAPATAGVVRLSVAPTHRGPLLAGVGVGGTVGTGFTTTLADAGEIQPKEFVTVKLYVPGERPVIVVVVPLPVIPPGFIVHVPDEGNPFNTTLPVGIGQVGWVIAPTVGAVGLGLTVIVNVVVVAHCPAVGVKV
jgi:hypothetical protein